MIVTTQPFKEVLLRTLEMSLLRQIIVFCLTPNKVGW